MESIGERLKQWRKKNGLTMLQIQEKTGLSTGGLSAYERNEKLIGSKTLLALYSEFNIDINYILTGKTTNELTEEESFLLVLYRKADSRGKRKIIGCAELEVEEQEPQSSTSKTG